MRNTFFILIFFVLIIGCKNSKSDKINNVKFWGMGTSLEVIYVGDSNKILEKEIIDYIRKFEKEASYQNPNSYISKINNEAFEKETEIPDYLCKIIEISIEYAKLTNGAFDITYKSQGFLWDKKTDKKPSQEEINEYLKLVGVQNIVLDCKKNTIKFINNGTKIDVGGVAKGWSVDETGKILKKYNYNNFLINFGGQILICGKKNSENWKIGIQNPFDSEKILKALTFNDNNCHALSTSGDYNRFFDKEGKKYSHIIDPKTGLPVEGGHSITVIGENSTIVDILSTAVSVKNKDIDFIKETAKKFNVTIYTLTGADVELKEYK